MMRTLSCLAALFVATPCFAAEGGRVTVKGAVVAPDGTPVAGKTIWLLRKSYSSPLQGKSVVELRTQTDAQGRLAFEFERGLFAAGEEARLATVKDRRWLPLLDEQGFESLFKLDPASDTSDLGTLRLKPE